MELLHSVVVEHGHIASLELFDNLLLEPQHNAPVEQLHTLVPEQFYTPRWEQTGIFALALGGTLVAEQGCILVC